MDDAVNEMNESGDSHILEIKDEEQSVYKENFWPAKPDEPKGFTYKGKGKMMTYVIEKTKVALKKGIEREIDETKFRVLDHKIHGIATQVTIEISDKEGRGNAFVDFWGPNKKKECTILIKKSREHQERFVKIVAKSIIQPLLDCFISGRSYEVIFKGPKEKFSENNQQCDICEKSFSSKKYLKVHKTKIHTATKNKCDHCNFSDNDKIKLRNHIKTVHEVCINPSMDVPPANEDRNVNDNLKDLEVVSWEEKRIDDQIMDTDDKEKQDEEDTVILERSRFRDEQIMKKEKLREEEEERYSREKEEKEELKRKEENKTKMSSKKAKKKRKAAKEIVNEDIILPSNIKPVPESIKHLVNQDDLMFCVKSDGACGPNSAAAHIFEDQDEGPKFRRVINLHIADRWSYYVNKINFPYKRQVGVQGNWAIFQEAKDFLNFLKNDSEAAFLWTDSEELHAIANLYQIKIKIITTSNHDDSNPRTNTIGPDPELEPFSLLPAGKVPDMVLIHYDNCHFNLLVSKDSRLVKGTKLDNQMENLIPSREFDELQRKYDDLRTAYTECLVQIEELKNQHSSTKPKPNKKQAQDDSDDSEEEVLQSAKLSGFYRDGPQSKALPKPALTTFACKVCKKFFKTSNLLEQHMENHTNDGDWNCDDCSHQTNSEVNLKKHIDLTHQLVKPCNDKTAKIMQNYPCNFCDKKFETNSDMMNHRKKTHRTFKPCRNLPNCSFQENCLFNHNQIDSNKFQCYKCGEELKTLSDLMFHRKNNHSMNKCLKFLNNECIFNSSSCWYNHHDNSNQNHNVNPSEMSYPETGENISNQAGTQPPVFWDPPANLAPPAILPTQATWVKMMSKMNDLNKMMQEMKESNTFLS